MDPKHRTNLIQKRCVETMGAEDLPLLASQAQDGLTTKAMDPKGTVAIGFLPTRGGKKDMLTNHVRQDARAMDPSKGRVARERVRNRHLAQIGVRDAPWIETSPPSKTQGKTTSMT